MSVGPTSSIVYLDSLDTISTTALDGFFVGWKQPPSSETFFQILKNSRHIVLAFDTNKEKVVGFINCISDGVLTSYIPLLEVLPEYRHSGIGSELIKRMLVKTQEYYMVDLCCDESLVSLYERQQFTKVAGMIRRNYAHQNGGGK